MKHLKKYNESKEELKIEDEYTYNIFEVFDYKGGELMCETNLSRRDVCDTLIEWFFGDSDLDLNADNDELKSEMSKIVDENTSIYAGGGDRVFDMYVNKDNKLHGINEKEFFDDIIDILRWEI